MPGMNGTGPQGQGPKTGRGAGRCAGRAGRNSNSMPLIDDGGQQNAGGGMRGRGSKGGGGRNCGGGGNRGRFGNRMR